MSVRVLAMWHDWGEFLALLRFWGLGSMRWQLNMAWFVTGASHSSGLVPGGRAGGGGGREWGVRPISLPSFCFLSYKPQNHTGRSFS